jgi:hypothetical protein
MTRLNIDYPSFDAYMASALNSATRRKLRKKFEAAAVALRIGMSVLDNLTSIIDDVYPLYLQVYNRSKLHSLPRSFSASWALDSAQSAAPVLHRVAEAARR